MKEINSYISLRGDNEINLNGNESYLGIEQEMLGMMKSSFGKVDFNRYPDNENVKIKELYSIYIGEEITKDNIVVGNGSDEMLGLIISMVIGENKKLLTVSPDFTMYDYYVSIQNGKIIKYHSDRNGFVDIDKLIELGKKENVDLVMFSNPNNPTGYAFSLDEVKRVVEAFPNIYVVIDEAYYEFYGESVVGEVNKYKNLIVTRTLSKAWGLAALRIGFLISSEDNIKKFNESKVPYSISSLSLAVAEVALTNQTRVKEDSKKIVEEREKLYSKLKNIEKEAVLEVEFFKSKANYIFGRTPYKEALLTGLRMNCINIRSFEDDSFRITIGSPFENSRLLQSLRKIFVYGGE
ncbi:histidinol-phosphate aminotransferase family protein [Clostridium sp. SHJSY1]|uniref:pyridoxal phosphate-dependent aminotransferase n=1 Tax=Clostridium sp. SHJSY1 TaxID=2942483 RepID=UPI0028744C9E|nr:histidinol-phosphate transaminase [Clostridium sp. SHJSY1]MDS0525063.1 histidinol-phosphate aminotransferase family protein [Clostridium sp. SHJSY1]